MKLLTLVCGLSLLHKVDREQRVLQPPLALQVKVRVHQMEIALVHGPIVHPHVKMLQVELGPSLLHKVDRGQRALKHPPVNRVMMRVHQMKIALVHGLLVQPHVKLLVLVCGPSLLHKVVPGLGVHLVQPVNQVKMLVVNQVRSLKMVVV